MPTIPLCVSVFEGVSVFLGLDEHVCMSPNDFVSFKPAVNKNRMTERRVLSVSVCSASWLYGSADVIDEVHFLQLFALSSKKLLI